MEKGPLKDHVLLCFVLMTHYFSGKEGHCLLNHQQNGSKFWFQTVCRAWGEEGKQEERAFCRWFLRILAIRFFPPFYWAHAQGELVLSVKKAKDIALVPCQLKFIGRDLPEAINFSSASPSFSTSVQVPMWFLQLHVTYCCCCLGLSEVCESG